MNVTIFEQYSDTEVIHRMLQGEIALFEILIRRNNPFLYKIGRSYNFNHEDTMDLVQETFIDAYTNLLKFENRSSFKSWVIKIMLNNCYRKQQKSSFKNEVTGEISDKSIPMFSNQQDTNTNYTVLNKELRLIIENALKKIPIEYRIVFSLREMNGLNVLETAEVLGITESNVKVRLNRAKTMLRKEIEKTYTSQDIFEFKLVYCDEIVNGVINGIPSMNG